LKLLPALSFVAAFFILYHLDPISFDYTWKGRTYYLFFVWTIFLETLIYWNDLKTGEWKLKSKKSVAFSITLLLPIIYVIVTNYVSINNYTNLNELIVKWAINHKIGGPGISDIFYFSGKMPLAIEYLVFTVIFELVIIAEYGVSKLGKYSLSIFLLGLIGFVYLIDNLYPWGTFTPFQIIVPTTASLAAFFLNLMGYRATLKVFNGTLPKISMEELKHPSGGKYLGSIGVGWQCSGVDSLIIYSVVALTFLRDSGLSRREKIGYFIIGAIVTYFVNILRIVSIFVIGTTHGVGSKEWVRFHDYYGPLYSIIWITTYPLIIIAVSYLRRKLRKNPLG
ncbi:archaeosortase/exosortase family protein, partial [Candidatus Bathyarchaeota archaeon]|nr:archaeosortase/exosortase family protein [Candidatus Bathyarchaeota archaeon]